MKLLIAGFNARPLAKAALQANHQLGVVDYFGDIDLLHLTRNCFAVLRQQAGEPLHRPLHRPPAEYLFLLAETMIEEQGDFDGILLGSGFDKYPTIVQKFHTLGPKVYANQPEKFQLCREKERMNTIARNAGFATPQLFKSQSPEELIEIAKTMSFPVVTRGEGGGGGAGIRKWQTLEDLKAFVEAKNEEALDRKILFLQEFIDGIDASATVVCSKKNARILSINRQLIGDKNLGAPGDFAYCGNIVPLALPKKLEKQLLSGLSSKVLDLFYKLKLVGINGVDFVLRGSEFYFMEVNPRLLGSLECTQIATKRNLITTHLDAFEGILPKRSAPKYYRTAVKGILFATAEQPFQVRAYPNSKWIVDRTHYQVWLEKGDPFCSIVLPATNAERGYQKVCTLAKRIQLLNHNTR